MSEVNNGQGFDALGLSNAVCRNLAKLGYQQPSAIQAAIIPSLLAGKDVIGQAQTGTGKTAAFSLPLLSKLAEQDARAIQVLVLAPTRELALQVSESIEKYGAGLPGMTLVSLCGGMPYRPQMQALRQGVQFVVGTPGRVIDHLDRGTLKLDSLKCLVLDEADEMLRMGFIEDVERVMETMPKSTQVALFSATMPTAIRRLALRFLKSPQEVTIKNKTETVSAINQRYLYVPQRDKQDALLRVLEVQEFDGAIVFTRTKDATLEQAEWLQRHGYRAAALNGDLDQGQREQVVAQLKSGRIDILIATDVVARGLDVPRITLVVNYDIPFDAETYVHRVGRTGRAGRAGDAVLFVTPKDKRLLGIIERTTRQPVAEMNWPTADEINQRRNQRFIDGLESRLQSGNNEPFKTLLAEWMANHPDQDPIELAAALAAQSYEGKAFHVVDRPRPVKAPRASNRERAPRQGQGKREPRRGRQAAPDAGMQRYRVAVGHRHGVKPGNLVGAIANEIGLSSRQIGRINIEPGFSTVDLPQGLSGKQLKHLKTVWVSGQQLAIEPQH